MSWMAVNNAPILGNGATDISGLSEGFRDGQKLRQEYEARQQQKALNELSQEGDFNARLGKARAHKYAGALVPLIQKQEQDRLIAEQTYNQGTADINKTNAEVGKINSEKGKIGAETTGQVIKNTGDTQNLISAVSVTRDPKIFALGIGEMVRTGIITPERSDAMIQMVMKDPANAATVLQSMVMANPELAKLFQPKTEVTETGDKKIYQTIDPFTGKYSEPYQQVTLGESPNNFGTRTSGENNNIRTTNASVTNNQYTVNAGERNNIRTTDATIYGTDSRAATASEQTAVSWYNAETGANTNAINAETKRIEANKKGSIAGGVDANGKPVARDLEANERTKLFELQEQIDADIGVGESLKRLNTLSDKSYSGVGASFRGTAMSRLPGGGNNERANATVLSENITIELALKQLKSTFGAAPTEGERKILMDLQASVGKSPVQKKQIIAAAMRAVTERINYRKKQMEGVRSGRYAVPTGYTPKSTSKQKTSAGSSIIGGVLGGK